LGIGPQGSACGGELRLTILGIGVLRYWGIEQWVSLKNIVMPLPWAGAVTHIATVVAKACLRQAGAAQKHC
jgi:hypothetical protein